MIAARIAHQEQAEPAPRRDPVRFLLMHRIDVTDRHPGLMLAIVAALIVLEGIAEQLL